VTVIFRSIRGDGLNIGHLYIRQHQATFPSRLKMTKMYYCETCNIKTNNKHVYHTHLLSRKHQQYCSNNAKCKNVLQALIQNAHPVKPIEAVIDDDKVIIQLQPSVVEPEFKIEHISTVVVTPDNIIEVEEKQNSYQDTRRPVLRCKYCNKSYKDRTGLWRHNKKFGNECLYSRLHVQNAKAASSNQNTNNINSVELTNVLSTMIQSNQEFKMQMMEMCKANMIVAANNTPQPTTVNSNTNNINQTNCHNPTFNLNFFLNEQCKDAMNLKDFVNSIELNITDMENVGKLGYVEGMSNIIIDNLQKTALNKRPVHCSDIKRETLYVKDADKWEREGPAHSKMVNAVLTVEHKNVGLMNEWAILHPKCLDSNSCDNDKYFRLSKTITDGEKDGNITKVIRCVAKNVVIDRASLSV
jgi:hypothetical protein